LNEANLLNADETGKPIWHKRRLLGSKDSHFWFEIGSSGDRVKKMIITSSPVEAVSAYLVERLVKQEDCPCLYLSLDALEQLNKLDLTNFDTVIVNSSDKQFVLDIVPNLVIEKNIKSWQQSWLTYWNEVQATLKPEAQKNNTAIERQSKHNKQLEL
jgi:hypothetical protein